MTDYVIIFKERVHMLTETSDKSVSTFTAKLSLNSSDFIDFSDEENVIFYFIFNYKFF